MTFNRNISTLGLLFAAVGGIVGSGWLFGPFYAATVAGPAAVFSWLLGGCLMMFIALTFAELSVMFPIAGGMVRFAQFSHGTLVSFTMAWVSWLASATVAPIETMAALQYAGNYIPHVTHHVHGKIELTSMGVLVAALVMLLMCAFNSVGVKLFSKTNNWIVTWKLLVPIATIAILLDHCHLAPFTQYGGFMPEGIRGVVAALPTAGVIFSFIGYSPAIQLAGESKNPQRAIPIAIIGSLSICIVLYVLLQVAFIGSVNASALDQGWMGLHFAGDAGPVAGIVTLMGIFWFVKILYIDAVISPLGTAYIYTAATARVNYAMSKNEYMPHFFQRLNRHGVPMWGIVVNFIVGMLFFLPFPGWQAMVGFLVSCFVLAYAVGPIACVMLRKTMPEKERPFRLPGVYWISLFAFYVCNLIIYWTTWTTVWRMLLVLGIGYLFLIAYRRFYQEPESLHWERAYWLFPYFIGLGLISYLGNFSGIQWIPFGWDFFVIAIFSIAIFFLATRVNLNKEFSGVSNV